MDLVRAHVERVEVVGLDEAYLDLDGLHSPRAAMRRLVAEIKRATQLTCSVGIGPNKLVAKVASDAEKPAGFVVLTREQACARFADSPPGLIPGIGPKTAARLAELGLTTLAAVGAAPEQVLVERFGPNHGRELGRRARFEHDGVIGAARKVVSESRERTFDHDVHEFAQLAESLAAMTRDAVRQPHRQRAQRAHDRHQGAPRRLDDRHARTPIAEPTCDYDTVFAVALRLLREYAPARPVRLLGVRVAGLPTHGDARADADERNARASDGVPRVGVGSACDPDRRRRHRARLRTQRQRARRCC